MNTAPMFAEPKREVLRPAKALPRPRAEQPGPVMVAVPLPDMPEPVIAAAAGKTAAQAERDAKPSWTSYSGKRAACDECLVFLHEHGGRGPFPRSVRRVRTVRATGEQLRLCKEHAAPREKADKAAAEKRKAVDR
jgi:hypothetical protein